ncbi:hypothetical protein [Streptomyces winkii]|uniref:hypothetical protein n=1 Tax=Streptomyces winkii TaxID=3051178 RepID=UPI0028D3DF25|nr:hypothetical protein [Streptomyces sp. DSM 40971]
MSSAGTIDRPTTRDPQRPLPKPGPTMTADSDIPNHSGSEANTSPQNRTRQMQLMPESLARAHMNHRLHEAESERRALRVTSARRLQRRAERASLRARRALAMAVMQ